MLHLLQELVLKGLLLCKFLLSSLLLLFDLDLSSVINRLEHTCTRHFGQLYGVFGSVAVKASRAVRLLTSSSLRYLIPVVIHVLAAEVARRVVALVASINWHRALFPPYNGRLCFELDVIVVASEAIWPLKGSKHFAVVISVNIHLRVPSDARSLAGCSPSKIELVQRLSVVLLLSDFA